MKIDLSQTQSRIDWLKHKLFLDANSAKAQRRCVRRGQVYRCNFGYGIGSEMQKERPAVIIQNNIANKHSANTIVIPITHDESTLPCVATITTQTTNDGYVLLDGQANSANIMCVSKARLGDYITDVSNFDMREIEKAIARSIGIMGHYSELNTRLNEKMDYIEKIKKQRNDAQDELKKIRHLLSISEEESIFDSVENLKKLI